MGEEPASHILCQQPCAFVSGQNQPQGGLVGPLWVCVPVGRCLLLLGKEPGDSEEVEARIGEGSVEDAGRPRGMDVGLSRVLIPALLDGFVSFLFCLLPRVYP